MGRISLLEKNAFLSIYANIAGLYATLAYSHYEIDRDYSLTDFTHIDWQNDPIDDYSFWLEYLNKLGEKFEWNILEDSFSKFSIGKIRAFEDEGDGVIGVQFVFDGVLDARSKAINALQGFFPDINISILDNKKVKDLLAKVAVRLGYRDAILLDLNIEKFDIYRSRVVSATRSADLQNIHDKPWESEYSKIHWSSNRALTEKLKDARLKAFATVDTEGEALANQWANLVSNQFSETSNPFLLDILRSFTTVQLLSIYNTNSKLVDKLGQGEKPTAVFIVGEIQTMLSQNQLYLSLLDGLQLRGSFDFIFSDRYQLYALGDELVEGVNAKSFITTINQVASRVERVFSPDIPGSPGEKKTVLTVTLTQREAGEKVSYALSSTIVKIPLPQGEYVVDGEFVKGAYIEGKSLVGLSDIEQRGASDGERFIWHSVHQKINVSSIVVDARFKPVVYGPDYRVNKNKISSWIGE